jgi:phosphinothricin acetyltransferase
MTSEVPERPSGTRLAVRDAVEADLPAILAITNHAILHTTAVWTIAQATPETRAAWMRERRAGGFPVLVADDDGAVAGFASFGPFRAWDGYAHTVEHSLYVDPAQQRRGIGRALLNALIERAAASGKHAMVGGIEASNAASIALHRAAGFDEAGVLREVGRKFDRWLDLLFMVRLL